VIHAASIRGPKRSQVAELEAAMPDVVVRNNCRAFRRASAGHSIVML